MVKKKTLADYRREVDAINKATSPQAFGKSPAPFLGQSSAGKKGTGSAMRKSVSSFDVSSSGVKDNLAPAPAAPQPSSDASGDVVKSDGHQDFPLATDASGKPVMKDAGGTIDLNGGSINAFTTDEIEVTEDSELFIRGEKSQSPYNFEDDSWDHSRGASNLLGLDMSFDPKVADPRNGDADFSFGAWRDSNAEDLHDENTGRNWGDPEQVMGHIREEDLPQALHVPDPSLFQSEAIEDVSQAAEVGAENVGEGDFDLIPEIGGGTPFGGLPDAMPAGPMLGGDMGEEAAPAHVPNEEMLERMDGAATSMSEYMEANTEILEGLANAIQALMVRMRNVESQIERF